MFKDYVGTLNEVAADAGGHALNVDVRSDDGATKQGWVGIDTAITREALAVALTSLTMGGKVSVRYDDTINVVNSVRARRY